MANRMAGEPSPYLRQHADNPVDWWPWGPAAFAEAKRRDVPVFLSIGYSTCHWCHVMAHESFEDAAVARRLNEAFVCVKVDREERPDVDDVYMAVCQTMTGSGGWPLTVFLTPEKKPFLAGTYFPKESRMGRMGMLDLIPAVQDAWRTKRAELERQAEHVLEHLRGASAPRPTGRTGAKEAASSLGEDILSRAAEALSRRFDAIHGGFGSRPKFPSPHLLLFLLRWHHRSGDEAALEQVRKTLEAMARGGLFDHVGGGFHRYSTDVEWLLPHFEKMLYDQAMLAWAYAEAHHATGDASFALVARRTLDYVLGDLRDESGGFHCAEDADSEGEEGKFYVWTKAELEEALGADAARFMAAFGVTAEGNFLDEATRRRTGANILHLRGPTEAWHAPLLRKLRDVRAERVRPGLDDKVLTDWNGLALVAFAAAGRILGEPRYVRAAVEAARFLESRMRGPSGLRHRYREGVVDDVAFLDDYAFLLCGLVELHQATQDAHWLAWAVEVAKGLQRFEEEQGGFLQSVGEELGVRRKEGYDGAMPSGNSAAAWGLLRLGLLTGDARWTQLGERTLEAFGQELASHPAAFGMMLCALDLALGPSEEVVVVGGGAEAQGMLEALSAYAPRRVLVRKVSEGGPLASVAPWTKGMGPRGGAAAYVCRGNACEAPVTSARELRVRSRP